MTTPHDSQTLHLPEHTGQHLAPPPSPRLSRAGLIATIVVGALVLAAGTGFSVWLVMRPNATSTTPAAAPSAAAAGTLDVAGAVILERGQFVWNSVADPSCAGLKGFDDIRGGAQVTVTDSGGKVLAIGTLAQGVTNGITTETDGTHRATTCSLQFTVPAVPRGVGPYGVEVAHRGVVRYDEGHLGIIRLSL